MILNFLGIFFIGNQLLTSPASFARPRRVKKKNNTWRVTNIKRKIDVHLSVEYQINHPNHLI